MPSDCRGRGFTLLEVMVALAVLAVAAAGLIRAVTQNVHQGGALEDRTVALWLAQNRVTELQVSHAFPEPGRASERIEMAGREWDLSVETSGTSHPGLRRVEVGVAPATRDFRDSRHTIVTLTAFLGDASVPAQ